jgi:Cys-rich protein (TIGR01571 family)
MHQNDIESPGPGQPLLDPIAIPVAEQLGNDVGNPGHWKDGCHEIYHNCFPTCVLSFVFPIFLLGKLADYLHQVGDERAIAFTYRYLSIPELGWINNLSPFYTLVSLYFIILFLGTLLIGPSTFLIIQILLFVVTFYIRKIIRDRENIPGDVWVDCAYSYFSCCRPCAIAQMTRHVFHIERFIDCEAVALSPTNPNLRVQ